MEYDVVSVDGHCTIEVVQGRDGCTSLYIGDESISHRLAGSKPWGGGTTIHKFKVNIAELMKEATQISDNQK